MLPDWRITAAHLAGVKSPDADVCSIARLLEGQPSGNPSLDAAFILWNNIGKREYIEAFLLVSDEESVAVSLDIPLSTIEAFAAYLFDTSVFTDKLQRVAYVHGLVPGRAKDLKMLAVTLGKEFLDWRIGNNISLSPDDVLRRLLTDSYTMAKIGMQGASVTATQAKEAYRWATLAAKLADTLGKRELPTAAEDDFDGLQVIPVFDEEDANEALDISPELLVRG